MSDAGVYTFLLQPQPATDCSRRSRKRIAADESPYFGRTLKQYSAAEKLEIIEYAKTHGNRAAGREFNVAESSIREWRKNEAKLIKARNNMCGSMRNATNNNKIIANELATLRLPFDLPTMLPFASLATSGLVENRVVSSIPASVGTPNSTSSLSSASSPPPPPIVDVTPSGSSRRKCRNPQKVLQEQ